MPCPSCGRVLAGVGTRRGIVWVCAACRAGSMTLPVLRKLAPRHFVNHVWQAARHEGRRSARRCPSCTQPFTTFEGSAVVVEPRVEVCTRCAWVWLDPRTLEAWVPGIRARRGSDRRLPSRVAAPRTGGPGPG